MLTFPNRALTATECATYKLTPATLMGTAIRLRPADLLYRPQYRWKADPGDNPHYRGLLDRIKVDRDEGYEVLYFITDFCRTLRISAACHAHEIERLLQRAPGSMVMRKQLEDWVWTRLTSRLRGGLLNAA